MAKSRTIRVSEEELAALTAYREQQAKSADPDAVMVEKKEVVVSDAQQALADAFVSAIERTRPPEKKTVFSRKSNTPWSPKNGEPRLKLKRHMYQHGMTIEDKVTNEDIALLNQIKPGVYCEGWVRVNLRKDKGLDIDYPIRTASQRLKLVNNFGITSFTSLLQRIIDEKNNPTKYRKPDDADIYDIDNA